MSAVVVKVYGSGTVITREQALALREAYKQWIAGR
jgi:hypothetical protein